MTLQKNFSHNLTAFYRRHAKTLTAFSEELGISRSSLQEIMKGNSNSRLDTVELVAKALGTNPLLLLSNSYTEEELTLLLPLLQFSDASLSLSDDEKQELASHFHAIIDILMRPKGKGTK